MKLLDISEVARRAGVPASTLRYYEETGMIASAGRRGLRRQFTRDVLAQLALINWGKKAGFSLREIARMFGKSGEPEIPRAEVHRKADEIDQRIRELAAVRDMLRHVAGCPAPAHMACPSFRRLLDDALPKT